MLGWVGGDIDQFSVILIGSGKSRGEDSWQGKAGGGLTGDPMVLALPVHLIQVDINPVARDAVTGSESSNQGAFTIRRESDKWQGNTNKTKPIVIYHQPFLSSLTVSSSHSSTRKTSMLSCC